MTAPTASDWRTDATTAERSRWITLAVVLAGAFMILLDSAIVNVAIPSIWRDLGASYGAIEWVVSGSALATVVERCNEQHGRRRRAPCDTVVIAISPDRRMMRCQRQSIAKRCSG
jgi:hypothetical protein